MIIGVSLVVEELKKGPRLVFSYPDKFSTFHERFIPGINLPHESKEYHRCASYVAKAYKQYYDLCQENFARLFVVKGSLMRKSLDFSIGDLNFISYPCSTLLAEEDAGKVSSDEKVAQAISMFNIIIVTISGPALLKVNKHFAYKCQNKFTSYCGEDPIAAALGMRLMNNGLCKTTLHRVLESASNMLLQLERMDGYVTKEVLKIIRVVDRRKGEDLEGGEASASLPPTVTTVVEFGRTRRSTSNASGVSGCSTLDQQAPYLHPAEGDSSQDGSSHASNRAMLRFSIDPQCEESESMMALLMVQSSLANELRSLFHNLTGGHSAALQFRGGKIVNVALTCKEGSACTDSLALQSHHCSRAISSAIEINQIHIPRELSIPHHHRNLGEGKYKGMSPGMQTMLLLGDSEVIFRTLGVLDGKNISALNGPLRHSRLFHVIEAADPTQSFFDLSVALDEPLDELLLMATYLQSWGLAEIIPVIYSQSVYMVHRDAPLQGNSRVSYAFDRLVRGCVQSHVVDNNNKANASINRHSRSVTKRSTHVDHSPRYNERSRTPAGYPQRELAPSSSSAFRGVGFSTPPRQLSFPYRHEKKVDTGESNAIFEFPLVATTTEINFNSKRSQSHDNHFQSKLRAGSPERQLAEVSAFSMEDWTMTKVLSLFDGARTVQEVKLSLPLVLQHYIADMVVFLLRWHMLVQVESYFVNLLAMPVPYRELSKADIGGNKDKQGVNEEKNQVKEQEQSHEEVTLLHNIWVKSLYPAELEVFQKLAPFLQHDSSQSHGKQGGSLHPQAVSSKSLTEIALSTRLREGELVQVASKVPFVRIVKKVIIPGAAHV